jgi:hypothetical protein
MADLGSKQFFFEKKNQATLAHEWQHQCGHLKPFCCSLDKSFLLLFFKKEVLPS